MASKRLHWGLLQVGAFLSGASALGAQMVWTRRLGLAWGHESLAMLAVLTAFFGAMSLGAATGHRPILHTRQPGRWFVGMQFVIAGWLALTSWFVPGAAAGVANFLGPNPHPFTQWLVVFVTAFVLLLPATLSMGGTLPALERCAYLSLDRPQAAGWLYAVNTGVAVVGVPHPHTGESVKAYVKARDGVPIEEDDVIDFCAARLPHYKCPNKVWFVEDIPRGLGGKVIRRLLG